MSILRGNLFGRPHCFVEALDPTVKCVLTIILRQRVRFAVKSELRVADTISVPADEGPKIAFVAHIAVHRIKAENDVPELVAAIRHLQRNNHTAVRADGRFDPVLVGQHIKVHRLAIG